MGKIQIRCPECHGAGIVPADSRVPVIGLSWSEFGVVCAACRGKGWKWAEEFTGLLRLDGVRWIFGSGGVAFYQANDGGAPYNTKSPGASIHAAKQRGAECRHGACPACWCGFNLDNKDCDDAWGKPVTECRRWPQRAQCWAELYSIKAKEE